MKKMLSALMLVAVLSCAGISGADEGSVGATGVVNSVKSVAVFAWNLVPATLNVVNGVVHAVHSAVHEVAQALKVELVANGD